MWVQELFIDEFDGGGDLTLTQLGSALNVVRMPSLSAEACLVDFIPTLFYGPLHPGTVLRGGSLVVTQRVDGRSYVLDLCRLCVDGAAGLSELEILTERDQEAVRAQVLKTLAAIDRRMYRAVFTDRAPPAERLAEWRSANWILPLLCRAATPSTADPELKPPGSSEPRVDQRHDRAVRRCAELVSRLNQPGARAPLPDAGAEAESPAAGELARLSSPVASVDRQAYLQAKTKRDDRQGAVRRLEKQISDAELTIRLLDEAIARRPMWDELQALDRQLAQSLPEPASEADLLRLGQIARQLRALHPPRPAATEAASDTKSPDRRTLLGERSAIAERLMRLRAIADDWPAIEDRQRQDLDLFAALEQRPPVDVMDGERIAGELQAAIAQVRCAAHARRAAARELTRQANDRDTPAGRNRGAPPARSDDSAADNPRIESLRRQVRQLRAESRSMLERQLLSPRALFGIGVLFSLGLALLGVAVTLNLDGAEIPTGTIGLICMLSAALLKSSFERTPTHLLRQQRLRIAELLAEVQRIHGVAAGDDEMLTAEPIDGTGDAFPFLPAETPTDLASADAIPAEADAAQRLADADRRWRQTLARWNVPETCDPPAAVRYLREHGTRSDRPTTAPEPVAADAPWNEHQLELNRHQAAVQLWTERVAAALERPWNAQHDPRAWRQELERAERRLESERARVDAVWQASRDARQSRKTRKRLRDERRRILEKYQVANTAELRRRTAEREGRSAEEAQRVAEFEKFQASLPTGDNGMRIRRWLEDGTDLSFERSRQRKQLDQIRQEFAAAHDALASTEEELARLARRPPVTAFPPLDRHARDAAFTECQGRLIAETLRAVLLSLADRTPVDESESLPPTSAPSASAVAGVGQPPLLELATAGLRRLLDDPTLTVGWIDAAQGPYIARGDGTVTSCDDLVRDEAELLVLALQLSLVRCLTERIGQLPLLLTDESLGLPEVKLARLAELLKDLAAAGQQILVITVDPRVSEWFRGLDVPSLVVTRAHARRSDLRSDSAGAQLARKTLSE